MMQILTLIISFLSLLVAYVVYYNNSKGDVIVYAQVDKRRPSIINLVIHNIGKGIAKDIKFICPNGVPKEAYGITGLDQPLKLYDSGPFVNGLPILFPDEKFIYAWGQYGGLKEALNGMALKIEISSYNSHSMQIIKLRHKKEFLIDPNIFEGLDISESSFEREIRISIQSINESLKKIAS